MNTEWGRLDLHTLKAMYEQEVNDLNANLLAGADWKEVAEKRKKIVEISIALDRAERRNYPTEFFDRNEPGKP